jgi:hypothetical protein
MLVVLPLIGTPVPMHRIVYLRLFGTLISLFGLKVTVAKLLIANVFQALDNEALELDPFSEFS